MNNNNNFIKTFENNSFIFNKNIFHLILYVYDKKIKTDVIKDNIFIKDINNVLNFLVEKNIFYIDDLNFIGLSNKGFILRRGLMLIYTSLDLENETKE